MWQCPEYEQQFRFTRIESLIPNTHVFIFKFTNWKNLIQTFNSGFIKKHGQKIKYLNKDIHFL
jgi:hypothetical protein